MFFELAVAWPAEVKHHVDADLLDLVRETAPSVLAKQNFALVNRDVEILLKTFLDALFTDGGRNLLVILRDLPRTF